MRGVDSLGGQAIVVSRCDFHARQPSVRLLVLMMFLETGSFVPSWLGSCLRPYPESKTSCLPTADAWKPEAGVFGSAAETSYKLNSLNHVIIKVEPYRAETGLTQCYNCQNFGHVWANCKQAPRCLWCGGCLPWIGECSVYAELL
jgi:hypothetical protein